MCSWSGCVIFVLTLSILGVVFLFLDITYLSRPKCVTIDRKTYSIPASLISVISKSNNSIIDKKTLNLISNEHLAVDCSLPTVLNQWSFVGIIDVKTGLKEGPGSIRTNYIDFDVWYANDKPNGPGVLRYKPSVLDEEGLIRNGIWQDGKLNCIESKPCELIMYLDDNGNYIRYLGPVQDNFLHGSQAMVQHVSIVNQQQNNGDKNIPLARFTFSGLSYRRGSVQEFDTTNDFWNVTLGIHFPHNITKEYNILKLSGLWNTLMNRFSPSNTDVCEVIYTVKGDPTQEERKWNCNVDRVEGDIFNEEHHIKGAFIHLIQFELYWVTKSMSRIPKYRISIPDMNAKSNIIQSRDEF